MSNGTELIRIKSVKVSGLFGLYSHLVALKDDRVTIIHGPNKSGKTVFLKLTNSFLVGRYSDFVRVPFDSFEVLFSNGSIAHLSAVPDEPKKSSRALNLTFATIGGETEFATLDSNLLNPAKFASQIADQIPYISQIGPEEFIDRRTEEVLDANEIIDRFSDSISQKTRAKFSSKEPKGLRELRSRVKAHFIEAQRLIRVNVPAEWRYRSPEKVMTETVQEYSRDLKRRLESTLANYAKQSQKLDQTFPQRRPEDANAPLPIELLKREMEEVESSRERLKRIGLLDGGASSSNPYPLEISRLDSLQSTQVSVMSMYARDTKEKLSVLTELAQRVELLLEILNKKFTNKRVGISRESGIVVLGPTSNSIPITALSSGEQHPKSFFSTISCLRSPQTRSF